MNQTHEEKCRAFAEKVFAITAYDCGWTDSSKEAAIEDISRLCTESFAPQGWLPVSERLPEEQTAVLATLGTGKRVITYWVQWEGMEQPLWNAVDGEEGFVTHWMPLPPAPPSEQPQPKEGDAKMSHFSKSCPFCGNICDRTATYCPTCDREFDEAPEPFPTEEDSFRMEPLYDPTAPPSPTCLMTEPGMACEAEPAQGKTLGQTMIARHRQKAAFSELRQIESKYPEFFPAVPEPAQGGKTLDEVCDLRTKLERRPRASDHALITEEIFQMQQDAIATEGRHQEELAQRDEQIKDLEAKVECLLPSLEEVRESFRLAQQLARRDEVIGKQNAFLRRFIKDAPDLESMHEAWDIESLSRLLIDLQAHFAAISSPSEKPCAPTQPEAT